MSARIVIAGGPKVGKTTLGTELAKALGVTLQSTDALIHMGWSEVSEHVAREWLTRPGPWVIEGVATLRSIRKWLAAHPQGMPCDEIRLGERPWVARTSGQESMAKGVVTVWNEIAAAVEARGVRVVRF